MWGCARYGPRGADTGIDRASRVSERRPAARKSIRGEAGSARIWGGTCCAAAQRLRMAGLSPPGWREEGGGGVARLTSGWFERARARLAGRRVGLLERHDLIAGWPLYFDGVQSQTEPAEARNSLYVASARGVPASVSAHETHASPLLCTQFITLVKEIVHFPKGGTESRHFRDVPTRTHTLAPRPAQRPPAPASWRHPPVSSREHASESSVDAPSGGAGRIERKERQLVW